MHDDSTNLVVLRGRLTTPVDVVERAGRDLARLTVAVRTQGPPRRIDAVPAQCWDPSPALASAEVGSVVLIRGSLRRRFWSTDAGRRSRLDVVADQVEVVGPGVDEWGPGASLPRPCP